MNERRKNCIEHLTNTRMLSAKLDELCLKIVGNGKAGIETRLTVIETKFDTISGMMRWWFGILSALISGVAVGIIMLLVKK